LSRLAEIEKLWGVSRCAGFSSDEVIDPVFDSRSGTFGIRLLLPNPNKNAMQG